MRVLVVGSGGREHALVWKLKQSDQITELFCATGNGGIESLATCVPIKQENTVELAKFAKDMEIDLTVIGPELPLSLGVVDTFKKMGLNIFGPGSEAAQLEASKVFAKLFMQRHNVPTAPFKVAASYIEATEILEEDLFGYPVVLKADGLAAGKGVLIAKTREEALEGARQMMVDMRFGTSGERMIIEKCLVGREISFMVICDGERFLPLYPSCDYKRAHDNDEGPNTGGMGAYGPSIDFDRNTYLRILTEVVGPTISGMIDEGRPFTGVLYCGLMMTDEGPKVLEYNVRFGDPETQVILPLLDADLFEILFAAARGKMVGMQSIKPGGHAVTVVIAAEGYPGSYEKGKVITGIDEAEQIDGVTVFHAGTARKGNKIVTTGGRVLNVTAVAETLEQAIFKAYQAADLINFDGCWKRADIAHNAASK